MQEEKTPSHGSSENGPSDRKTHWTWLEPVLYALLALVLNLAGNARTGLWDRDEPRYAVCVREMRDRGDWIFPTFNGEPRYHKPVLIYWLMRLSTALAGDNPFGTRLVSALAGAATVLGVTVLGRRMLGRGGGLAGLILATAPIAVAESKLATTDATLALLIFGVPVLRVGAGETPFAHAGGAILAVHEPRDSGQGPGRRRRLSVRHRCLLVLWLAHRGLEAAALAQWSHRLWRS